MFSVSKNDIESVFGIQLEQSSVMEGAVSEWLGMYISREGMRLPVSIASETARLVTLEMKSGISGSPRAEYLNERYMAVLNRLRNTTELACACGGIVMKPYITASGIAVDMVRADRFIPVEFDDDGKMMAVIFIDKKQIGRKYYTRLEYHRTGADNTYEVSNRAFVSENSTDLGRKIPLSAVPEWTGIETDVKLEGVDTPLFSYFCMPMANNIDTDSPLGVSVFERAKDLIKDADEQYKRLKWEFDSADRFVGMADDALRPDSKGNLHLPKREKRLFKMFSWDADNHDLFKEWSPTIREQNYINGLNDILRRIEFNCGLAYGTLSDVSEQEKTAEEIKASKQRSYSHISDIQKALQTALEQLIAGMDIYANLYSLAPKGKYEISFEWDDSIVADRKTEFTERIDLVTAGALAPWELRMWYTGETEEQAKAAVGVVDMTEE